MSSQVSHDFKSGKQAPLIHPLPSLHIRVMMDPAEAAHQDDRFILKDSEGFYERTRTVKDDMQPGDEFVDLIFEDLKMNASYTLRVKPGAEGSAYAVFEDISFRELVDYYSIVEHGEELEEEEEEEPEMEATERNWEDEGDDKDHYGGGPDDRSFEYDSWVRETGDDFNEAIW